MNTVVFCQSLRIFFKALKVWESLPHFITLRANTPPELLKIISATSKTLLQCRNFFSRFMNGIWSCIGMPRLLTAQKIYKSVLYWHDFILYSTILGTTKPSFYRVDGLCYTVLGHCQQLNATRTKFTTFSYGITWQCHLRKSRCGVHIRCALRSL